MRLFAKLLLLSLAGLLGAVRAVHAGRPPLASADDVARAVLVANPELEAVEGQIEALEHVVTQAGVWPDPVAGVEYGNMPWTTPYLGAHPMSGIGLRLQQTILAPGKTRAREDVARGQVRTARHGLAEKRDQLAGLVRDLYYRLALVRQLGRITETHVELVAELVEVARARYEAGQASQHELLQLQVLHDRLVDDVDDFGRQERELLAALDAALHVAPGTPIGTPGVTPIAPPPAALDQLVERALVSRPLLAQIAEAARTEGLAARRAEIEKRPDVTVFLGYRLREEIAGRDSGEDFVTAGVSVPLVWFWNDRRWGARAQEHRARRRALEAERRARVDELRGKLEAALAAWRRSYDKAERYEKDLVPGQRRTLDSTRSAYQVGRADFATLYRAETELLAFERAVQVARAEAARARAEVATLVGVAAGGEDGP